MKINSIDLYDSDLYQNGRVYDLGGGELVLLRERYDENGQASDSGVRTVEGQDLRLLSYRLYLGQVPRPEGWWWLLGEQNSVFDPLFGQRFMPDGTVRDYAGGTVRVPNVLKRKAVL